MKIDTIRIIVYGAFIIGALIMLLAAVLSVLSDYITMFMYIGGAVGAFGMIFCANCLRYPACTKCKEFVYLRKISTKICPLCGDMAD